LIFLTFVVFFGENAVFGEKIKAFAKKKFGSLNDLSLIIEVNPNQMSSYTTENRKPGFEMLQKLYENGCDIHWLLDDKRPIDEVFNNNIECKSIGSNSIVLSFTPEQFEIIKGIILSFKIKIDEENL